MNQIERYVLLTALVHCVICYVVGAIKLNLFRSGYGLDRLALVIWIFSPILVPIRTLGRIVIKVRRRIRTSPPPKE